MSRKNTPSFSFNDPAVRQKAIETRLANVRGKRARHRFEDVDDLPGMWPVDARVDSLGRKIGKKERQAQRERAIERLEEMVDDIFDTATEILKGPPGNLDASEVQAWAAAAKARALIVNKAWDKLLPDLRTVPTGLGARKITQIMIGGPLQSAMKEALSNGAASAVHAIEVSNDE